MAKGLRLLIAAFIVLFPVMIGWYHRTPWIIPILAAVYVPLYFLGKSGAWSFIEHAPTRQAILRAIPITFVVQCLLVGIFYLVGVGFGTLFGARTINWSVKSADLGWIGVFVLLMLPVTFLVAFLERPAMAQNVDAGAADNDEAEGDFAVLERKITPETFYNSTHYSRQNFTGTALTDVVDYKGEKPVRTPKQASEKMIATVEDRLGFRFPETLRKIYKIQDGGSLPTYYAPNFEGAAPVFDNWTTAFAADYDDLQPLDRLRTMLSIYEEEFDPDYDDASDKNEWIKGADKLIILTIRTGYGTALDYRAGNEPGVLLFDMNMPEKELLQFESFDAFLAAIREIDFDYGRDDFPKDQAFGAPPNPLDPDRFWEKGNAGAGVTDADYADRGRKLGVTLPPELLPFFKAANGGKSAYFVAVDMDGNGSEGGAVPVFPTGPYVYGGNFSKLEYWASLATLSDRLDFMDERTPWRALFDKPEKLIVIYGAFDGALMLDYRLSDDAPGVVFVSDLDDPETAVAFSSVENFLSRLRQYGVPSRDEKNEIGDARISARLSNADTFLFMDEATGPVSDATLDAFLKRWDFETFGLPSVITQIYKKQNGGAVRFRFAPPQSFNKAGYAQSHIAAEKWQDVYPAGWLPMEEWQLFEVWRDANGYTDAQSLFDFTDRITDPTDGGDTETKVRLFVIGDDAAGDKRRVTLLDMSSDYFNRNRHISTLEYNRETGKFDIVFGPILSDNIYSGLYQTMRALKSEL